MGDLVYLGTNTDCLLRFCIERTAHFGVIFFLHIEIEKKMFFCVFALVFACTLHAKLTCIGEHGEPVDMYVIYKLPRMYRKDDVPPRVKDGHGYVYSDVTTSYRFQLSDYSIADEKSAPGRTLNQVYKQYDVRKEYVQKKENQYFNGADNMAHVFYNDENPNGTVYFDCGHTKGGLAFDKESGFWLIHSVPKYLSPVSTGYSYPHSGCKYGQMFMCVTLNSSVFDEVGMQLRLNEPHVHDGNLPYRWREDFPNIQKLFDGDMVTERPFSNLLNLQTLGGKRIHHFAKNGNFGKDLYLDFIAPTLQADLYTETWQFGTVIGPSCDNKYKVNDVTSLNVKTTAMEFSFQNHNDHSKFVVSREQTSGYVCVGDINREPSQFRRGGGSMCYKNPGLWSTYRHMINSTNLCKSS